MPDVDTPLPCGHPASSGILEVKNEGRKLLIRERIDGANGAVLAPAAVWCEVEKMWVTIESDDQRRRLREFVAHDRLREKILDTVADLAGALLYYDRKEDAELPPGAIEDAVLDGVITWDEMLTHLTRQLLGDEHVDVTVTLRPDHRLGGRRRSDGGEKSSG